MAAKLNKSMISRDEALKILNENIKSQNLIKHSLAVEAIMRGLAKFFKEDEEKWGILGLLHDIDYEKTRDKPEEHSLIGSQMLKEMGFEEEFTRAVASHNEIHNILPDSLMAKALFVSDPLSGLIVASTLVLPSKKISDLTVENVLNRFKEKAFARSVNRQHILKCEEFLSLSLEKFIEIALNSMKQIASDLSL